MWIAWGLIPILQVISNRYLRYYWRWRLKLHVITGTISLVLTIVALIMIMNLLGWVVFEDYFHNAAGSLTILLCFALIISGIFTIFLLRVANMDY